MDLQWFHMGPERSEDLIRTNPDKGHKIGGEHGREPLCKRENEKKQFWKGMAKDIHFRSLPMV